MLELSTTSSLLPSTVIDRRLSVAPMMGYTDRFFRMVLRAITQGTLLYTEMVTTWALLHGDKTSLLNFHPREHPIALQLGGNEPEQLAISAKLGADWGYDEINLNLGCPSERVHYGRFGACLMADPELVVRCLQSMRVAVSIPVTIKHRIGIDGWNRYYDLQRFVGILEAGGCTTFIVHARQAKLGRLSPKENRTIPPLHYDFVYQLKQDFPKTQIILNGGITNLEQVATQLQHVDGVMIGRAAYHNPWLLAQADQQILGLEHSPTSRQSVLESLMPHIAAELAAGVPLGQLTNHLLGLFYGVPGARAWRRYLSEHAHRLGAGVEVLQQALEQV